MPLGAPMNYLLNFPAITPQEGAQILASGSESAHLANVDKINREKFAAEQKAAAEAKEREKQYNKELNALLQKENPTARDYANLMARYPEKAESIRKGWSVYKPEVQRNFFNQLAQTHSQLVTGNPKLARDDLIGKIKAIREAGNETEAKDREHLLQAVERGIKSGDMREAIQLSSMNLSAIDPEKFTENFGRLEDQRRTMTDEPTDDRRQAAEADAKEAEAEIKAARAKLAPEEFAAKAGLTRAQIGQSRASAASSYASAALSRAKITDLERKREQEKTGQLPTEKAVPLEQRMLEQWSRANKPNLVRQDAYRQMYAVKDAKPGEEGYSDLVYSMSFSHSIDPTSAVIGSEREVIEKAPGIPTALRREVLRVYDGGSLTPKARMAMLSVAKKMALKAQDVERHLTNDQRRIARASGLNPDHVHYRLVPLEETPTSSNRAGQSTPSGQNKTFSWDDP